MYNIPSIAMIFAAGRGTRMKPLTDNMPKPMAKILGKTLIDYRLDKLKEIGVKKSVVNTHHFAEMLQDHLKKRSDMEIIISHEPELLETGGGLVKALPLLGNEPFYVMNSDMIWTDNPGNKPALLRLAENFDPQKMDILLLLQPVETAIGYVGEGDFNLTKSGQLTKTPGKNDYVFTGVQIMHPRIMQNYDTSPFSLSKLFVDIVKSRGSFDRLYGIKHEGAWLHVDTVEGMKVAEDYLVNNSLTIK